MKVPEALKRLRNPVDQEMSLWDHLEELRRVILSSLAAVTVGAFAVYAVSGRILEFLVAETVGQAQFLRPTEGFMARLKLSLLLGLVLTLPFVFFQIWTFIVPGLLKKERRAVVPLAFFSTLLFLGGIAFSSFLLTPTMVRFLVGFSSEHITANLSISYLLDFFIKMGLACGLLFQLPLVIAILSMFEVLTPEFLMQKWRHAVVVILIISAVVTPSDAASQLALAAPVMVLYAASIVVSKLIWRRKLKERREAAEASLPPAVDPDGEG
jgi:sec-independent protein translocase protein TatC